MLGLDLSNEALLALKLLLAVFNTVLLVLMVRSFASGEPDAEPRPEGEGEGEGERESGRPTRVLLVTAHPDDESMFFVPTLTALRETGHELFLACMSAGDADGLGETRKRELEKAARLLGFADWAVVEHAALRDGLQERWDPAVVAAQLRPLVERWRPHTLLSFDERGVSGHPNHVAVCRGVRRVLRGSGGTGAGAGPRAGFELQSTGLVRKYLGAADALLSLVLPAPARIFLSWDVRRSHRAMATHWSQFVWYRRLFVLFSRYTFVNTLVRSPAAGVADRRKAAAGAGAGAGAAVDSKTSDSGKEEEEEEEEEED